MKKIWVLAALAGCATDPNPREPVTFIDIAVGIARSCALGADSVAYCWGANQHGQLGIGNTQDQAIPVPVASPVRFASIVSGLSYTCAVAAAGGAYCWGGNTKGQLGDASTVNRTVPVRVSGDLNFSLLSAGAVHTCGLTTAGLAYCWGANDDGQLGDGTVTSRSTPTPVTGGLVFVSLAAGEEHTCGITAQETVYCWGANHHGLLGDGTSTQRLAPTPVTGGIMFTALTAGAFHSCGISLDGRAYCWGSNSAGNLGDGAGCDPRVACHSRSSPVAVAADFTFSALSARSVTCGIATGGAAYCWGENTSGSVGTGAFSMYEPRPKAVVGGRSFTRIASGGGHVCGLSADGGAYCWGGNMFGELGEGLLHSESRTQPVAVVMPTR